MGVSRPCLHVPVSRWRGPHRFIESYIMTTAEHENAHSALRDTVISGIQMQEAYDSIPSVLALSKECVQKVLVARPQQTRDVLHQENPRAQTPDELEITEDQRVAWVSDPGIFDSMHRKPLAGRTAQDEVASAPVCEMGFQQFFRRQVQNICGIDLGLLVGVFTTLNQVGVVGVASVFIQFDGGYDSDFCPARGKRKSASPREQVDALKAVLQLCLRRSIVARRCRVMSGKSTRQAWDSLRRGIHHIVATGPRSAA